MELWMPCKISHSAGDVIFRPSPEVVNAGDSVRDRPPR